MTGGALQPCGGWLIYLLYGEVMYMYPQSNSARSVRDLSGVWDFRFNANEPWQPIAVPAS